MADITISDLELAPALADDMVFPVENLTDTYAATLAMLRRLLNKTFVEEEDADFNDLTDDGFYQCTGTPTNSPVAGSIVWTLQVSTQGGVTVQRAFSLDDDFENLYIRRWNGVTWTTWIEEGGGALTNKANIDLDNLSATGEAKIAGAVPTGSILPYGGSTAPTGWLLCNGGAISRTTYADLFAVIGTTYGAGDGSTTFNLPNLSNLYLLNGLNVYTPEQNCRGNGYTMALTNGSVYVGLVGGIGGSAYYLGGRSGAYATGYGYTGAGLETGLQGSNVGLTTDARYSGVMRDAVTSSISNYQWSRAIIKY